MHVKHDELESSEAVSQPQLPASRSEGGFRAVLADAGLWDLVQMNCESRMRSTVRVGSGSQYGHLFFDAGQGNVLDRLFGPDPFQQQPRPGNGNGGGGNVHDSNSANANFLHTFESQVAFLAETMGNHAIKSNRYHT